MAVQRPGLCHSLGSSAAAKHIAGSQGIWQLSKSQVLDVLLSRGDRAYATLVLMGLYSLLVFLLMYLSEDFSWVGIATALGV